MVMMDAPKFGNVARVLAEQALAEGDATTALRWIDDLPAADQPPLLLALWMLAGSPRAVARVLPELAPADRAAAEAFIADPPRRVVPTSSAADAHADLSARAADLAARGLAAELAMTHLGLADVAPRPDWAAVHIEHAASLAMGLGDVRLSALVRAYEARREAGFGEWEDALEAANAAIELATAADEPSALAMALVVLSSASAAIAVTEDRASEPQDL